MTIAEAKALVSVMLLELEQIDNVDQAVCLSYLAIRAVVTRQIKDGLAR